MVSKILDEFEQKLNKTAMKAPPRLEIEVEQRPPSAFPNGPVKLFLEKGWRDSERYTLQVKIFPSISDEDLKPVLAWVKAHARDFDSAKVEFDAQDPIPSIAERLFSALVQDGGYSGPIDFWLNQLSPSCLEAWIPLLKQWDARAVTDKSLMLQRLDMGNGVEAAFNEVLHTVTDLSINYCMTQCVSPLTPTSFASLTNTLTSLHVNFGFDDGYGVEDDKEFVLGLAPFSQLTSLTFSGGRVNVPKVLGSISPSLPKLETITLMKASPEDYEGFSVLNACTNLKTLMLSLDVDVNAVDNATITTGSPILLPACKQLCLSVSPRKPINPSAKLTMPLLDRFICPVLHACNLWAWFSDITEQWSVLTLDVSAVVNKFPTAKILECFSRGNCYALSWIFDSVDSEKVTEFLGTLDFFRVTGGLAAKLPPGRSVTCTLGIDYPRQPWIEFGEEDPDYVL